jgi:hypothetical protein
MRFLFECKACRQRKQIVLFVQNMQYCEDCKHKAPRSRKEFREYTATNGRSQLTDWRHRGANKLGGIK